MNKGKDALDDLLFSIADEETQGMDFDRAWQNISAAHRKKTNRKRNLLRYSSMAAALIIFLGAGVLIGRLSMGAAAPGETNIPEDIIEAPMTDGGAPDEIIIDPPKTDAQVSERYGDTITFANLPRFADAGNLLPAWLPEGLPAPEINEYHSGWYTEEATQSGEAVQLINAVLFIGGDIDIHYYEDLTVGQGVAYAAIQENGKYIEMTWYLRLTDAVYLRAYFFNITYEDALRVLESIAGE